MVRHRWKKTLLCLPFIVTFLFCVCFYMWNFFGRYPAALSKQDFAAEETRLKDAVSCALRGMVDPTTAQKASATLDFMGGELVRGFDVYGISSNIEKAHFLAQVMFESGYFTKTVEGAGGDTWRDGNVFDSRSSTWKCGAYLNAIHSDKDFFDTQYIRSRDKYRAKFRGRGLIQLTHCYNYVNFFYHEMAKEVGRADLTNSESDTIMYSHEGISKTLKNKIFCENEELASIAEAFKEDSLHFPRELITNFENTVDRLSLPCEFTTVSFMQSPDFIVDTSLWFWEGCRRDHPEAINRSSDEAVGILSDCVNGSDLYLIFDEKWCQNGEPVEEHLRRFQAEAGTQRARNYRRTILASYCSRLRNFNALVSCL